MKPINGGQSALKQLGCDADRKILKEIRTGQGTVGLGTNDFPIKGPNTSTHTDKTGVTNFAKGPTRKTTDY